MAGGSVRQRGTGIGGNRTHSIARTGLDQRPTSHWEGHRKTLWDWDASELERHDPPTGSSASAFALRPHPFIALEVGRLGSLSPPTWPWPAQGSQVSQGIHKLPANISMNTRLCALSISRQNFVLSRRYFLNSPAVPLLSESSWQVSCSFGVAIWKVEQLDIVLLKYHSVRSFVIHTR